VQKFLLNSHAMILSFPSSWPRAQNSRQSRSDLKLRDRVAPTAANERASDRSSRSSPEARLACCDPMQQSWMAASNRSKMPRVRFHRITGTFAAAKCRKSRRALKHREKFMDYVS
ncbi:hypothetical protein, partial [Mesorhizobium sp. M1295]|uniref:hypothetical protein n=1 Tax=Mesorhizobium sp. M1295 TaxID=2957076 RepID=UPI0033384CF9